MEYRQVGASDVHVSLIGLGTNNFNLRLDAVQSARVVRAALDMGVSYFDTADIYGKRGGAERFLGEALGKDRQRVVLGTKFGIDMDNEGLKRGASRRYIVQAVEASLQRLGTDWIDIYHIHHDDPDTPLEETLGALDDLVRAGKIRHSACSNFSKRRLEEGINVARLHGFSPWVAVQDELSLLRQDNVDLLLSVTDRAGLGFLAFLPLAGGLLTGKYSSGHAAPPGSRYARSGERNAAMLSADNLNQIQRLAAYAQARGRGLLDLAMGWLASEPRVSSIIVGATSPDQLTANIAASQWRLSSTEREEVARLMQRD